MFCAADGAKSVLPTQDYRPSTTERTLFLIGYPSDQQSEPSCFSIHLFSFSCSVSLLCFPPPDSLCLVARKKETFPFTVPSILQERKFLQYFCPHSPIPPFNFFSFCLRKKDFLLCHCVQSTVNF